MRSGRQEAKVSDRTNTGQSGGVNISGSVGSVGGDIVGRDKVTGAPSTAALASAAAARQAPRQATEGEERGSHQRLITAPAWGDFNRQVWGESGRR